MIAREDLIPLSQLCLMAHDVAMQQVDKHPIPTWVNYTINPLLEIASLNIHNIAETPRMGLEDSEMALLRILSRWTSWRGETARSYKQEFQLHLDYAKEQAEQQAWLKEHSK
jgi:hypothetical protein